MKRTPLLFLLAIIGAANLIGPASGDDYPVKLLFPGNWADPTVVKIGDDYYLTSNNDHHVPSVLVFHSKDLRQWKPISYASPSEGQGPATDIIAHDGRLYIYGGGGGGIPWVMVSDPPYREWSTRLNMNAIAQHGIDAGHIADREGNRFLYTNGGKALKLTADGLRAATAPQKVYDGWPIPDSIDIECFCLESPKLFLKKDWYYMVSAQGGTAGPATSHMAVVARSRQPLGPWEESPHNPLIWTEHPSEAWWSKGHATLLEGPQGNWYAIYHGYPNSQRSFGRSTLISPVEWTDDGWPKMASDWPDGWDGPVGVEWPLDDDFNGPQLGMQWQALGELQRGRFRFAEGRLVMDASSNKPGSSYPLTVNPKHRAYEVETEVELEGDCTAGLILYYSPNAYLSLGLSSSGQVVTNAMTTPGQMSVNRRDVAAHSQKRIRLRLINHYQDASAYFADTEGNWVKIERSKDISGFQHNVYGGFLSVRPGIFTYGSGTATFTSFRYRGLE